jgi:hypothetical protein
MKKHYLLLSLLAFLCLSFTACNDDDDEKPDDRKLLTSKNWKITGLKVTQGATSFDFYAQDEPCNQDDVWKFADNGTYQYTEGATKCDPTSPDVYESGTWTLNNGTLTTTESGNTTNYKVVEITANSLKLSTEMVLSGTNTTIDFSFAGQ